MKTNKFFLTHIRNNAKKIGVDEFGNSYYEGSGGNVGVKKRYVVYRGMSEPSKIPAEWHAWLHYYVNNKGDKTEFGKYSWQKIHIPNLTGTIYSEGF